MDNGDHEWLEAQKCQRQLANEKKEVKAFKIANEQVMHVSAAASSGHPAARQQMLEWSKNGFYIQAKRPHLRTIMDPNPNGEYVWQLPYPKPAQTIHVRQEEKETNTTQLELELQRAKVRQLELELQQAQMHPQNNTQADHHQSGFERDLKKADRVIKTTTHGVDLFNSLQNTGFF
jgi:hypothetical protein